MKRLFKVLFLASAILLTIAKTSYGKQQEPEGVMLPEVGISCSQHTVDFTLSIGFASITYHVLVTDCDNGEHYYDLV